MPDLELLDSLDCQYYAHGDDPCFSADGIDVTQMFREANRFKVFKRTEGVSTTDITGKLVALARIKIAERKMHDEKAQELHGPLDEETSSSLQLNSSAGE